MKKLVVLTISVLLIHVSNAQKDSASLTKEIINFQHELNKEYKNPETSPLPKEKREAFTEHKFFPINLQFALLAKFIRTPNEKVFMMPTSGTEKKMYVKYGEALFTLMGREYKLSLYQSIDLAKQRKYRDYLFIPFRDATSGKETYGGGRYLDLTIPQTDSMLLDFNKAYHPYCAYTEGYNCPIPPRENYLPIKIEAGIRF